MLLSLLGFFLVIPLDFFYELDTLCKFSGICLRCIFQLIFFYYQLFIAHIWDLYLFFGIRKKSSFTSTRWVLFQCFLSSYLYRNIHFPLAKLRTIYHSSPPFDALYSQFRVILPNVPVSFLVWHPLSPSQFPSHSFPLSLFLPISQPHSSHSFRISISPCLCTVKPLFLSLWLYVLTLIIMSCLSNCKSIIWVE